KHPTLYQVESIFTAIMTAMHPGGDFRGDFEVRSAFYDRAVEYVRTLPDKAGAGWYQTVCEAALANHLSTPVSVTGTHRPLSRSQSPETATRTAEMAKLFHELINRPHNLFGQNYEGGSNFLKIAKGTYVSVSVYTMAESVLPLLSSAVVPLLADRHALHTQLLEGFIE
ncbi:hypothetical protein KIPB_011966, partial [Kipferlia bialata]